MIAAQRRRRNIRDLTPIAIVGPRTFILPFTGRDGPGDTTTDMLVATAAPAV